MARKKAGDDIKEICTGTQQEFAQMINYSQVILKSIFSTSLSMTQWYYHCIHYTLNHDQNRDGSSLRLGGHFSNIWQSSHIMTMTSLL